ncbi:glycosyltransferase [Candidatus Dependentiae bacterium]|nr:MAG: glycosyltransferase [Candidatus Dependentiae bacterium]
MKPCYILFIFYFIFTTHYVFSSANNPKIVALVPGHNDGRFLRNCFKILAKYVDAIVYLDDASTDNSVAIAHELEKECNIEQILCKKNWIRHAGQDRNMLLSAGRAIGGTHFLVIDADELPTANFLNELRRIILNLKPGERLALAWIQLWRSCDQYRYDNSVWTNNYKDIAFCDDGICYYRSKKLCESRTPETLEGKIWFVEGYEYGLLHLQFVNWENLLKKQAWYRCQEHLLHPERSFESINNEYAPSKDETQINTKPAPKEWFENYNAFLDLHVVHEKENWREQETMNWFSSYGIRAFMGLDIWDPAWPFNEYIPEKSSFLDTFVFCSKNEGTIIEIGPPTENYNPATFLYINKNWQMLKNTAEKTSVDLYLINENKYIDEKIWQNHYCIGVHQAALNDALMNLLTKNQYAQIPYNDNGYYYFIHLAADK